MVTQTITINLTQSRLAPIIMRSEEKGREIQFDVIDEAGEPEDLTGYDLKFMMLKPDGNVVYADLASGLLTQTEQMTTSKGKGYYCIRILDDDTIIYSGQGPVVVDDHVIDDETLDSISEVDGLVFPDDFATTENIVDVVDDVISGMSFAVIADNHQNLTETWSSEKIANYAEVMADGLIADNQITEDHTWSSDKINTELTRKAVIDDNTTSSQYTWSSSKIDDEIDAHSEINDNTTSSTATWSSDKINSELGDKAEIDDNTTSSTATWSSDKIADEISGSGGGVNYSTTEHEVGKWIDNKTLYEKTVTGSFSNTSTLRTWYDILSAAEISALNIDIFFISSGSYVVDPGGDIYTVPQTTGVSTGSAVGAIISGGKLQMVIEGIGAGTVNYALTIRYTKSV